MESAPSRTAMFAAVSRGLFRLETASPWVLDDVLALVLVGPVWQQLRDQFDPLFPGPVRRESRAAVCTRSRYAEDRLAAGAFTQYVILGAGLDSFAWRRPDLLGSLTVFEVDHPASQAWKLERVRELGLPLSDYLGTRDPDDPTLTDAMWLEGVRKHFSGQVILGQDLLEI